MARDTALPMNDGLAEPAPQRAGRLGLTRIGLTRTRGPSLTVRILAVNVIALALLAGSFFYLDSYRTQLLKERFKLARAEAEIIADAVEPVALPDRRMLIARIGSEQRLRLRLYGADNALVADSLALAGPSFALIGPKTKP